MERQAVPGSDEQNRQNKEKQPLGRVRHDKGGRAIWEWAVESGKHAIESTSMLLKKLDISGLHLTDDPDADKPGEPGPGAPGGGFNPYDTRTPTGRGAATPLPPKAPPKPRITQPPRQQKKPGFFGRLFGGGRK